ncbi:MAG: Ppx/GppA phosphatase family protein [Acidimicrobiales bacterium]
MTSQPVDRRPVAAIDCGTNSTRLLVLAGDRSRIDRRMRITRLGAGVDRSGSLDAAAVARTLETLEEYRKVMDSHGVEPGRARATATSAARDASNSAEFLDRCEGVLGVRPEIIEGEVEGRLSYAGATDDLDPTEGPYLVVDIGGGSTELIAGTEGSDDGGGLKPGPGAIVSLDIGCVRVTERFLHSDPPSPAEIGSARATVRGFVTEAIGQQPGLAGARRLVGLAGTVSAMAVMALGLDGYDEHLVHHARISRDGVRDLTRRLCAAPLAERRELRGMERERSDVIVGGAIVLEEVMDCLRYEELTVSESDILDGIAFGLLASTSPAPAGGGLS